VHRWSALGLLRATGGPNFPRVNDHFFSVCTQSDARLTGQKLRFTRWETTFALDWLCACIYE